MQDLYQQIYDLNQTNINGLKAINEAIKLMAAESKRAARKLK